MIGYICKYTPVELIRCFDEETIRIEPNVTNFEKSDAAMHPNMCSYSKCVMEECYSSKINSVILVNCCDSIKRLYDVLSNKNDFKFLYIMDIPRKLNDSSVSLLRGELLKLIKTLEDLTNIKFNPLRLLDETNKDIQTQNSESKSNIKIALLGARCKDYVGNMVIDNGAQIIYDSTCTGFTRKFASYKEGDILTWYAYNLLNQFPCMRMADIKPRYEVLNKIPNLDGIIYHTIKFCDVYSFDYAKLRQFINIPILKIETDYTNQSQGQIKTRVEAFIESLKVKIEHGEAENIYSQEKRFAMGIDSGSTSTNVVIIDERKNIVSFSVVKTGAKSLESSKKAYEEALRKAKLKKEDISYIVSTGYGRVNIPFANVNITEITCHGKGAFYLNPRIRTVIDIGGQDSKVIRLNEKGEVVDFSMNDKCAAGTGRFLEMMARTLEISLDEMSKSYVGWKEEIAITSICTVFAESEVVSLIAQNKDKTDIIHALNNSISGKIISMLQRIGQKGSYMMSGGVAKNNGVVISLEQKLGEKLFVPKEPEIVGALGAAILALENSASEIKGLSH